MPTAFTVPVTTCILIQLQVEWMVEMWVLQSGGREQGPVLSLAGKSDIISTFPGHLKADCFTFFYFIISRAVNRRTKTQIGVGHFTCTCLHTASRSCLCSILPRASSLFPSHLHKQPLTQRSKSPGHAVDLRSSFPRIFSIRMRVEQNLRGRLRDSELSFAIQNKTSATYWWYCAVDSYTALYEVGWTRTVWITQVKPFWRGRIFGDDTCHGSEKIHISTI